MLSNESISHLPTWGFESTNELLLAADRTPVIGRILSIVPTPEGQLRSRNVVSRSNHQPSGKYPSIKMERHIQWESPNELNAYRLLDADPTVFAFEEQPLQIIYEMDGEERSHYPDVKVCKRSGDELWEIKTRAWAMRLDIIRRTLLMVTELPALGYQYRMVIAEELGRQPRLSTVNNLLRFGRKAIPDLERERLRRYFEMQGHVTWGDVLDKKLGDDGRCHVSRLMLEGSISWDSNTPLRRETVLTPTTRERVASFVEA